VPVRNVTDYQVNGNRDLHESLEASTAHEAFDSGAGAEARGGQERWFAALPPVLFLELSRFQFDRSRGVPEKINNPLEFPEVIYLDRYLEANKAVTRVKREQVRRLAERRTALQRELAGYTSYGSGEASSRHPLASVLQLAMEFARSGSGEAEPEAWEAESQAMQVDSPCHSPRSALTPATSVANLSGEPGLLPAGTVSIPIQREGESAPAQPSAMEVEPAGGPEPALRTGPIPRRVSDLELKVLSGCLQRWGREVEDEIATLNGNLRDIETRIAGMYEEEALRQRGSRLHAVMVHEGDAQQGHYWAYVRLPGEGRGWLKFNDNTVSQTTWEELSREAVGGRLSTSAYSCVYVDLARPELVSPAGGPEGGTMAEVQALPPDLDTFILEDNKSFAAEVVRWDEEQLLGKKEPEVGEEAGGQAVLIGDDPECQIIVVKPDFAVGHALLVKDSTLDTMNALASSTLDKRKQEPNKSSTSVVINKIYQLVKLRVQGGKAEGLGERQDARLESFLHYLVANDLSVDVYRRALLEQVSLPELEQQGEFGREVARAARDSVKNSKGGKEDMGEEIELWHKAYHQFRYIQLTATDSILPYTSVQDCCQLFCAWSGEVHGEPAGGGPGAAHGQLCCQREDW
jgi:ubiquitin carboxyl-terminal hydrolase 25/28